MPAPAMPGTRAPRPPSWIVMPYSKYLPEHMGAITLSPAGPFVAGSYAELTLVYTAGTFGIDDTGMVKVSWRTTSDFSKPQFNKPDADQQGIGIGADIEAIEPDLEFGAVAGLDCGKIRRVGFVELRL